MRHPCYAKVLEVNVFLERCDHHLLDLRSRLAPTLLDLLELFNQFGIEAITTGIQGTLEDILNAYLRGEISGATGCEHHH